MGPWWNIRFEEAYMTDLTKQQKRKINQPYLLLDVIQNKNRDWIIKEEVI
jgi:hypothetical protein